MLYKKTHIGIIKNNLLKCFFSAFFIVLVMSSPSLAKMVSINNDGVNIRSGPGENNEIQWEYGKGVPLFVIGEEKDWYKIKDFENDTGWVYKALTSTTPYMIVKANKGTNKKVNIRSGPGTGYNIVAKAYYGVVFKTIEQKNGWVNVEHDSGTVGWVKRSLLWGF